MVSPFAQAHCTPSGLVLGVLDQPPAHDELQSRRPVVLKLWDKHKQLPQLREVRVAPMFDALSLISRARGGTIV